MIKSFPLFFLSLVWIQCSSPQMGEEKNEGSRSVAQSRRWIVVYKLKQTPYEITQNTLYFVPQGRKLKDSRNPRFSPKYKGEFMLDSSLSQGFTQGAAGTPYQMILKDGSRVVATLWTLGDHYMLRVFKPDFSRGKVRLLCEFEHFSKPIEMRQRKDGKILVQIVQVRDVGPPGTAEARRQRFYKTTRICGS